MTPKNPENVPIQPVDRPILCSPYEEPNDHWQYDTQTGAPSHGATRRPAGYWYKDRDRTGTKQLRLLTEEHRDDLPLVNLLREDVRRWRESGYRGATPVTRELLQHWARPDLKRRLFFCQREAVETVIYLAELRISGKSRRTGFHKFALSDMDLEKLLRGERPAFELASPDYYPKLVDQPADKGLLPLVRLGCKMATGSGKTVVMTMLIAWAFCNRARNPASRQYPNAVLVCCPNLTVKERLQVLRPEYPDNYYEEFDIVPQKYRPLLSTGKVLVTNWHAFAPESEHKEGDRNYAVVNKGPETPDTLARRVLGDLYDRLPIMVLNDEGHHCWRPAPFELTDEENGKAANGEPLSAEERKELQAEAEEATVWIEGLDRLNNALRDANGGKHDGEHGIALCVDLSATPFYIQGSGYPEGRPFPWLVSDFGLVDAIESGIVKIPRLPVSDTTGRPDPAYFRLWETIKGRLEPIEFHPGKARKPKADAVFREATAALQQIAGQWVQRFEQMQSATVGQERVPPALIIVCDNTEIAEVFYQAISGEREEEAITEAEVDEALAEDDDPPPRGKPAKKPKRRTVYGHGEVFPEFFSNTPAEKRTIRIDVKLLAEAESEDPNKTKQQAGEELRRVVATVGKRGQPGEFVRCVVSVAMLTEGWDANNVTHILGLRAFGSQLLCEQVVGRGLRRIDYTPDPATGLLTEEYVDVYGIPFSVIPFKGRPVGQREPDDSPKNHVMALPDRAHMEMRFPVVEGYAVALRQNLIRCDIDGMPKLDIEPNREPTATFVQPTVGYQEGAPSSATGFGWVEQNREKYYRQTHLQTIQFEITRRILDRLVGASLPGSEKKQKVLRLQSRHQLFPQIYRYVAEYVQQKVDFHGAHACELGLRKYVERVVERLSDGILPDDSEGEPPLLPVLNRYQATGSTANVEFKTKRRCSGTRKSHINQVVLDTDTWEATTTFRLETSAHVEFYARNDHLGLVIPYDYQGIDHGYEPDFVVRLANGLTLVLEVKGFENDTDKAKHAAAQRWVSAVNNWGELGKWRFHVSRDPHLIEGELSLLANAEGVAGIDSAHEWSLELR
ncbi:MAG: hypothetical protein WD894_03750 [Pirellulales bacterium]